MKQILIIIFLSGMLVIQSCEKHDHHPGNVVLNAMLSPGEEYRLDLSQYSKEASSASIKQQAAHYDISEIIPASAVYHYKSSIKSGSSDQVVLSIADDHHHCGNGNDDNHADQKGDEDLQITVNFTIR